MLTWASGTWFSALLPAAIPEVPWTLLRQGLASGDMDYTDLGGKDLENVFFLKKILLLWCLFQNNSKLTEKFQEDSLSFKRCHIWLIILSLSNNVVIIFYFQTILRKVAYIMPLYPLILQHFLRQRFHRVVIRVKKI